MTTPPAIDSDATSQAIHALMRVVAEPDDLIEVRVLPSGQSFFWRADKVGDHAAELLTENASGQNVYYGANPRKHAGGTKAGDVAMARCLFADFDGIDEAEARQRMRDAELPEPAAMLNSGHGLHCYWRLAEPMHGLHEWRVVQKRLIAALDSDDKVHDPPRILRLPGFVNHKEPAAMTVLIEAEDYRVDPLADLVAVLPELLTSVASTSHSSQSPSAAAMKGYGPAALADESRKVAAAAEGNRNHAWNTSAFRLGQLVGGGHIERGAVVQALTAAARQSGLAEEEISKTLRSGIDAGLLEPRDPEQRAAAPLRTADDHAAEDAPDNVIDYPDPIPLAEHFINGRCRASSGAVMLRRWRGEFHRFDGAAYRPLTDEAMDAELYNHLDQLWTPKRDRETGEPEADPSTGESKLMKVVPRAARVREVRLALPSRDLLIDDAQDAPLWLDGRTSLNPREVIVARNGLLHLPTLQLHATTPEFFSTNALSFDYQPDAAAPQRWMAFLRKLWPDDAEAVQTLRQWFGYALSHDTRQQKMLLLVGPRRAGKGTIARVLTALLGEANVAAPTLGGLSTNFGLQALLSKQLAIISDARLSGRADQAVVVERLLSISGEDHLTIDRKHRDPLTVKLDARLMILTNELPRLADSSGALAGRFVVLTLGQSWYGNEDHSLTDRLLEELPGILNWAIEGWRELQQSGHLTQPASSAEAIQDLEDLGSPIGAYIRDRCNLEPGHSVEARVLYEDWKCWCGEQGRDRPGTLPSFGRDLRSAVPGIRKKRPRGFSGERVVTDEGISLK